MIKSLITAAAVAGTVLTFSAPEASAKTDWDIHIGLGTFLPIYEEPAYGYRYYEPEVRVYGRPRYVERRQYEHRYVDDGMSCRTGKRVVRSAGFNEVDAYDCSAPTYGYTAWKHGDMFKVRVNYQGDIVSVRQID